MKRRGKKTIEWEAARAKLKQQFLHMGVTTCEFPYPHYCWRDNGLSFAHSKKRRYIKGKEIYEVALLCPIAHEIVERLPQSEMCDIVRSIIRNRNLKYYEQKRSRNGE